MKKTTLRIRLLSAIAVVSAAAIVILAICFFLMLGSVRDDALARGKETNDGLITTVLHGFAQSEGNSLLIALRHAALEMRDQAGGDSALAAFAARETFDIWDGYFMGAYFFIARGGTVTAAGISSTEQGELYVTDVSAEEMTRLLRESALTEKIHEYTPSLEEYLGPFYANSMNYDTEQNPMPLLVTIPIGENDVVGIFLQNAESRRVFEALGEVALASQEETAAAIDEAVFRYVIILAVVGVAMLIVILLLARRLSRAIAEPVEREKEMLEEVSRLKSEFLADISHELKTPLTVMSSHAQHGQKSLRNIPEAMDAEHGMKLIASEADRLALMVSQVLDITRIDEGRMTFHKAPHSVMTIIQRTMDTYYPVFGKNDNTLRVEPFSLPDVLCDDQRIMQVLVNLIGNAARHTRDGEIVVSAEQQGDFVHVSVRDTGEGIPPERMETLFDRYREKRGAGDTGTGLGLPICKYMVDAHGGALIIESEVGRGTIAMFTLPIA